MNDDGRGLQHLVNAEWRMLNVWSRQISAFSIDERQGGSIQERQQLSIDKAGVASPSRRLLW
ncbi:MAG TPA: hypothetical protein VGD94_14840 [Vicinamibacterales bacterium]